MKYYDLKKNWPKVEKHLGDEKLNKILVRDFNKYTWGRWKRKFEPGMVPRQFESCDWDWDHRGKRPAYWQYVKHAACHWLVNFNLRLARLVMPDRPWRIVTSQAHSTVWDGDETLFDFNFLALGVPPDEAYATAASDEELAVGKELKVYMAVHFSKGQQAMYV